MCPSEHDEFVAEFDRVLRKHTGRSLDDPPWPPDKPDRHDETPADRESERQERERWESGG